MGWAVRLATVEDAGRICAINRDALGYDFPIDRTRERLSYILQRDTERIYVAYRLEDGYVGGYLHAADYENTYTESMKNILSLAVDQSLQGYGLGRMLLNAVEAWAQECGCVAVRLISGFNRIKAHEFYLHCGYWLRKEEKNFIKSIPTKNSREE